MATGTQDLQDIIVAAIALVAAARDAGDDGWQITDTGVLLTDEELGAHLLTAVEGAGTIPDEVADLSFSETLELVAFVAGALQSLGE